MVGSGAILSKGASGKVYQTEAFENIGSCISPSLYYVYFLRKKKKNRSLDWKPMS